MERRKVLVGQEIAVISASFFFSSIAIPLFQKGGNGSDAAATLESSLRWLWSIHHGAKGHHRSGADCRAAVLIAGGDTCEIFEKMEGRGIILDFDSAVRERT